MYITNLQDDYSVINRNGIIEVLKNGEVDVIRNDRYCGDRVVLFLMQKIEELASRPTCGQEQRLFLDEVRKKFKLIEDGDDIRLEMDNTTLDYCGLDQFDFKSDLRKGFKGEEQ
jgi:hypothetical protein